ncbi:MAG: ABC transporter ATP-binding protein [Methanomicrobiales archaeon]|nr:ABC transporter ATP-binding protein [Methanomicrobiales archaeon]
MTYQRAGDPSEGSIVTLVTSRARDISQGFRHGIRLLGFFSHGFKGYLAALLLMSIVLGLLETFQIVLLYPIMNATIDFQGPEIAVFEPFYHAARGLVSLPDIVLFSVLFVILVFLTYILSLVYRYTSICLTRTVITKTKRTIFDKLVMNDYQYFVENKRGDIIYNVVTAPAEVRHFLETSTGMFSESIIVVTIIIAMLFISPPAVVVILGGGLLFILVVRFIGKKFAFRLGRLQMRSMRSENEVISGYLSGLRQIRSVCGDGYWREKYDHALDEYWDKYTGLSFFRMLPAATLQFLFLVSIAVLVVLFYYLYQEQFLYIIPLMGAFVFSALKVIPRLSGLSNQYMQIMDQWPNLDAIYRFLNDTRYHTILNGIRIFDSLSADIVFDNVDFSYYPDQDLLEGINLAIRHRKVTALVGHSGSGKSTIVSLLLRYYDVDRGSIRINGYDLRDYDKATFLGRVGYVSQDTFVYNVTVRENIAFGGSCSDAEIIEAARKANIHDFIDSLPEKYYSIVGDQGIKLSGGEKQRIAIARALVRNPELLVLDEATSNLDNESEAIVQDSINRISENITTFIIAHRLSTIRKADTIYVMSAGKIVESGTHDELMERQGTYFELYESER